MPPELRKAHQQNDKAVMQAYGFWGKLNTETECVAELMKMYQELAETAIQDFSAKQYQEAYPEEEEIEAMSAWMTTHGLNEGTANHELLDDNGDVVAIIDLAWPHGVQQGLSAPLALLLNETAETQAIVSKFGYRYYTSVEELQEYIQTAYLQ